MKKTFLYFCLLFIVQTAFAADSLYVREQQIPILIDRIDNVLYEMRIPAQKRGCIKRDHDTDRRQCQSVGHPSDTSIL